MPLAAPLDAYPMAAKLLLDRGDSDALRYMLNTTLHIGNVNYKRVYDFAMLNLIGKLSSDGEKAIDTVSDFIYDIHAARKDREAADMLVAASDQLHRLGEGAHLYRSRLQERASAHFASRELAGGVRQRLVQAGALSS